MNRRRAAARWQGAAICTLLLAGAAGGACSRMVIGGDPSPSDAAQDAAMDSDARRDVTRAELGNETGASADVSADARDADADADADAAVDRRDGPGGDGAADRRDGPSGNGDGAADGRDGPSGNGDAAIETRDGAGPDGGAPDGSSDLATTPDAGQVLPIGIIGGRVTMSSSAGVRGAGVAGVRVTLSGPAARSAISDANGAYAFPGLLPGSYALALAKDGATFTPAGATVVVGSGADAGTGATDGGAAPAGVVASFTCTAPCGTGPAIDPARELYVIDTSVITDARASNTTGGPWSFRYLMEQAAPIAPNLFAEVWIANLEASGRNMAGLRVHWPTVVANTQVLPDLSRAPFALLAIVNGVDAHSAGQGEARLVYGIHDSGINGSPELMGLSQRFTVMFRYALPATAELPTRQAWAARFHALGATPFGPAYNAQLQALTDLFTPAAIRPSTAENPRGSALIAVSINEAFDTNTPAQLRESQVLPDPVRGVLDLMVTTLEQTPDDSQNGHDGSLPDFLNANAVQVQTGLATLPAALLGTRSSAFNPPVPWSFPSVTSEPLRHAFAGQTCVGCHSSEGPTAFTVYHIIPFDGPLMSSLSGYLPIVEIPRRVSFMQNQLTCAGATCALGAEPMMGPAR